MNDSIPVGRQIRIVHRTTYRYATPVLRSSHLFRLRAVQDRAQALRGYRLDISVGGARAEFEDVFGNQVEALEVSSPFEELEVVAASTVDIYAPHPPSLEPVHRRSQIPLMWMPWQRQMMLPYLLPPELPESQLQTLSDYAMSIVERNDYDLVETLLDLNLTIYRDFAYVTGSTNVETTPFEVFRQRSGVCQDFANLLICLARLLSVPARYRVGYIYTGGNYENKIQSDASHAWSELYLPGLGWRGFDPTNGCLTSIDHVRVACGRHYRDATPTSGTIYQGGGNEFLAVDVRVEVASN
jgi:transglutaminase-like putative cysteine protease